MPILSTIADLFRGGAVAIAEQFVRGFTAIKSFSDLMLGRIGSQYQVSLEQEIAFLKSVTQAAVPAQTIQGGGEIEIAALPTWLESQTPGEIIQTGLAEITMAGSGDAEPFSTHIPFTFHNVEVLNYESILDRIGNAVESGDGEYDDFYQADIDRIEQALKYHNIRGGNTTLSAELYSIFRGA